MLITCFAFYLKVWNVIWEMRFRFILCRDCLKRFILVIMLDYLIVSFFWSSYLIWRMTHAHSRLSSDVCLFSTCRTFDETFHQFHCERLIKLDQTCLTRHLIKLIVSDLSNLTSEKIISSNLTKAIHQIWWRYLIKTNERVISSNFWEERQFFYFLMSNLLQRRWIWRT